MKPNKTVRFTAGKYAGLVGVVHEVNDKTGMVLVFVSGVVDGESVTFERWFKADSLEVI